MESLTATAGGGETARAAGIHRAWTRACRRATPERWWGDRFFAFAGLQLFLPLLAALLGEAFLRRAPLEEPLALAAPWIGDGFPLRGWMLLFGLLWPLNGWLLCRQAARRLSGRLGTAAWPLLGLAAGTPLAGFVLLPVWRRWLEAAGVLVAPWWLRLQRATAGER